MTTFFEVPGLARVVYRKPFFEVTGPGSENMLQTWGSKLIGARLVDRTDGESDDATFMFTRKPPYTLTTPAQDTPYTVRLGWSGTDMAIGGVYTFQRAHIFGSPGQGQQIHLICRAGDLGDFLKRTDSQHFGEDNGHKTLGDVFRSLFKDSGKTVTVHPDIDKLPLPGGYGLRWNQSGIDMAQELAETYGGYVKPSGGGIAVMKAGAGQSASGQTLPTIAMLFDDNYEFDVELEPRFSYSSVSSTYLDTEKGTLEREQSQASGSGKGGGALPHPAPDKESARAQAEARAAELARFAGVGLFSKAGDPAAVSEAPVTCSGFGSDIDGVPWHAKTVTNDVIPDRGWTTTVETESAAGAPTGA